MSKSNKNTNRRSGMAAVEMALVLPIFIMLLLGMFDVGRWCWARNVVQDAAAQGARAAMLHEYSDTEVIELVALEVESGGLDSVPDVVIGTRIPEEPVSVTVSVPFKFHILSSVVESLPESKSVTATSVVRHER